MILLLGSYLFYDGLVSGSQNLPDTPVGKSFPIIPIGEGVSMRTKFVLVSTVCLLPLIAACQTDSASEVPPEAVSK